MVKEIMPSKRGFRMKRSVLDLDAAQELELFVLNDGGLYGHKKLILANLQRKANSGKYDKKKAVKLWEQWVKRGAQKYTTEVRGSEYKQFNKATREHVAAELADRYPEGRE